MSHATIWRGGRVFTGDRYAEALLADEGEVVAVGSVAEVHRVAPTGTETVDLRGGLLLPGLIDAHLHLGELALLEPALDLSHTSSREDLLDRVRSLAPKRSEGVIVGRGWSLPGIPTRAWPSRTELDRVESERPLLLYHASGHAVLTNSAALREMGIDRTTPDPAGGRIERDPEGTPSGPLFEMALASAGELSHQGLTEEPTALRSTFQRLSALGVTSVGTMNTSRTELRILTERAAEPWLSARVRTYPGLAWWRSSSPRPRPTDRPSELVAVAGVKAFADGAFGTRTAWLTEPYADDPTTSGMAVQGLDEMIAGFAEARDLGLAPAVHALGDRGVAVALDALEGSRRPGSHTVERLEHAGLVPPSLLARVRAVRPVAVVQPMFVLSDDWLGARLGPERSRFAYPFRSLGNSGAILAGSSDAPFDALDPWEGMRAAVDRRTRQGASANPSVQETLRPEEALAMYTRGGARALHLSNVGRLEPGSFADLIWVDGRDVEQAIARGARGVQATWLAGRCVHARGEPGATPSP